MTPEEALEKWCPFVRMSSIDARPDSADPGRLIGKGEPSYNRQFVQDFHGSQKLEPGGRHTRVNAIPSHCRCIADGCMMWTGDGCGLARNPSTRM